MDARYLPFAVVMTCNKDKVVAAVEVRATERDSMSAAGERLFLNSTVYTDWPQH